MEVVWGIVKGKLLKSSGESLGGAISHGKNSFWGNYPKEKFSEGKFSTGETFHVGEDIFHPEDSTMI